MLDDGEDEQCREEADAGRIAHLVALAPACRASGTATTIDAITDSGNSRFMDVLVSKQRRKARYSGTTSSPRFRTLAIHSI